MPLTYILVDFENVQPNAVDVGLVRGDAVRLAIFRGPGQMKYAADLAEAWQPLGANLTFIRCAKAGRNAVDMHIAFYLGELIAAQTRAAGSQAVRFVVVSRDTDFDPLLLHIRSLGFEAQRVATIRAALGGPTPASAAAPRSSPAKKSAATKTAARKAPAAKAPAVKEPAAKAPAAKSAVTAKAAPAGRARKSAAKSPEKNVVESPREIVLASLRSLGERRPSKRNALERHIESHLGRKVEMDDVRTLVDDLERDGWLKIIDNKVDYALPKSRK